MYIMESLFRRCSKQWNADTKVRAKNLIGGDLQDSKWKMNSKNEGILYHNVAFSCIYCKYVCCSVDPVLIDNNTI